MTRDEAIRLANQLAATDKPLAVIFDKQLNDYFISENDGLYLKDGFYGDSVYELVGTFAVPPKKSSR